ncbi:transcription factor bHLH155-like [Gastrolobium bilobum]|uniref:transcription factor bHLH155-like n=1 Tax=Gastrolobium bilobum TaxID=150636 RepID=UPI002AB1422A|nr:transcription factor bHLH155-like [Gastrolobium bilobum]
MAMAMPLTLRHKLKTLCTCGDGWSYAIFWRFNPQNSLMLSVEEAYYEEQLGEEITNMLPQVHLLGEGIISEAAFTGKHSWVHSDGQTQEWNLTGKNIYEDDSGLHQQLSYGIKTMVIIPVKDLGVVQFGSKKKILERMEFLDQTLSLLMETDNMGMLDVSGNAVSSLDCENYDLNGLLASVSSENSYDWNLNYAHNENSEELLRKVYSSVNPNDPFPSQYKIYEEGMTSLGVDSSCLGDQLNGTTEAQVVLSDWDSTDVLLKPNSSMDSLIPQNSSFGAWNDEASSFDLLGEQLLSEIRTQEASDMCSTEENAFASSTSKLLVQDSVLTSLDKMNRGSFQDKLRNSLDNQPQSMDDVCQWFAASPEDSICRTVNTLDNNNHDFENSLLDGMELDFNCDQDDKWWENILTPGVNAAIDTGFSKCISELNIGSHSSTQQRLFSQLGNEQLLSGEANYNTSNSFGFENELLSPNKRQMLEFPPVNASPLHFANLAGAEARANLMQPVSDLYKTNNSLSKKDTFPKSEVGMRIDDSHSINIGKAVPGHFEKPKEPTKANKRRAKPGKSTRPRPKDRQQIQDCIKELRKIIPNGEKCSIDSLLDRTTAYMHFLQNMTKYADRMQEPNEPKLIDQPNGVVRRESSAGDSKNCGVTCAFEVASETMICPIIVEDMSPPGQMLIEMLCEEQGFFLELVDKIRDDFGLNILKAKMEIRKNKLWARFIVEVKPQANRYVTRIHVFWSLTLLLQQTNTSGMDSANKHCNVMDANIS